MASRLISKLKFDSRLKIFQKKGGSRQCMATFNVSRCMRQTRLNTINGYMSVRVGYLVYNMALALI